MNTKGKRPYRHLYCDVANELPFLAKRSCAVVFLTIGIKDGVTVDDIMAATRLDERTIGSALSLLEQNGFIQTSGGKYISADYIEDKRTGFVQTNNVCTKYDDHSINRQSKSNQSSSVESNTEKDFVNTIQALSSVLLLSGGIRHDEAAAFNLLWDEYPDAELHARALRIMQTRAERPNYKYYEKVVRSGAYEKPTAQTVETVTVIL